MAIDQNPYAAGYGAAPGMGAAQPQQQQQQPIPDYLKQQDNPTAPGIASNMVRALMSGYLKGQKGNVPGAAPPMDITAPNLPQADPYGALFTPPPASPYGAGSENVVY